MGGDKDSPFVSYTGDSGQFVLHLITSLLYSHHCMLNL